MFDLKEKQGVWLKGNLHMHTTASDGKKTVKQAAAQYKENGYDFIAITDHWKYYKGGDFKGMTILSGIELDAGKTALNGVYHIVGVCPQDKIKIKKLPQAPELEAQRYIDAIHEAGGIAVLAHPAWSLETPEQIDRLKNLDMTEVYNSVSDEPFTMRADSGDVLDAFAQRSGFCPYLSAVDDTHYYGEDACRGYIMLKALDNSPKEIRAALLRGDFYASKGGPEIINISREQNKVKIEFKGAERLLVFADNSSIRQVKNVSGKTEFVFDFDEKPCYFVRFVLEDEKRNRSWTSFVFKNTK